jgi:hypothetical protein
MSSALTAAGKGREKGDFKNRFSGTGVVGGIASPNILLSTSCHLVTMVHNVLSPSRHFTKTTIVSKPLDVYFAFTLILSVMILYRLLMSLKHGYVILKKLVLISKRSLRVE